MDHLTLNQLIKELAAKGLTDEEIVREIDQPDKAGLKRVRAITSPNGMQMSINRSIRQAENKRKEKTS